MSGEETDKVVGRNRELARVPVEWINPALSDLFTVIDSYDSALQDETFSIGKRGNRELTRVPGSKNAGMTAPPVKGLPRNWYHDTWLRARNPTELILLQVAPSRPIPNLVSSEFRLNLSASILVDNAL